MKNLLPLFAILLALFLFAACEDDDESHGDTRTGGDDATGGDDDDMADDDTGDDDDTSDDDAGDDDTALTRSFYMAAAPYQHEMLPDTVRNTFDTGGFRGRVDMLSLHMDFWGVPWEAFADGTTLPPAWVAKMEELRGLAGDLGVPVYLSVTPLGGRRTRLSDTVRDMGDDLVLEPFGDACHDVVTGGNADAIRQAYAAYVLWMADFFQPALMTHVIEMNLYDVFCPDAYGSLIVLANEAYDALKGVDPSVPVFPTFTIAHMWGSAEEPPCAIGDRGCLAASLERNENVRRDRFGISAYPMFRQYDWERMPDDYFTAVTEMTGETIVFAETGWGSRPVVIPWPEADDECFEIFTMTDADQTAYMRTLFETANAAGSDLVVWWSLREFIPLSVFESCPCDAPDLWCVLADVFRGADMLHAWMGWGSMGVMDYDFNDKPSAATWDAWLARERTRSR